jgi:hypothetical protein
VYIVYIPRIAGMTDIDSDNFLPMIFDNIPKGKHIITVPEILFKDLI